MSGFGGMMGVVRSAWGKGLVGRGLSTLAEEAYVSRSKSSCTVPVAYTKFDAKVDVGQALPPVVLLHGLLGSQMMYRSVVKRRDFAPMRDVYTVDLRNHGQSPHVMEMGLPAMTRDISKLLDDEGIESACVIGHNIGGKVGMVLALDEPERVAQLAVMDAAPSDSCEKAPELMKKVDVLHDIDLENFRQKKDIEAELVNVGVTDDRLRQYLMANVVGDQNQPGTYKWKMHIQAIQEAMPAILGFPEFEEGRSYKGPALFAYVENSSLLSQSDEETVSKYFPNAKYAKIDKYGLWLPAENPEHLCTLVNDFLGDKSPTSKQAE